MRIEIDSNNRVVQYSYDDIYNELLFDVPDTVKIPEDFEENAFFYKYENEQFIFDSEYKKEETSLQQVVQIRSDRLEICFPVINRGQLWYDILTNEQKKELAAWYQAWLDATETLKEPEMPDWLKEMM